MAGAFVEIDITEVRDGLARLVAAGRDLRPVLLSIGEELAESTKQRFSTGTDPQNRRWVPLSPKYLARKRLMRTVGGADRILVRSGVLADTIAYQVDGHTLMVGSSRKYAATHQFGRGTPGSGIPARPFLGLSQRDRVMVLDELAAHLGDAVG